MNWPRERLWIKFSGNKLSHIFFAKSIFIFNFAVPKSKGKFLYNRGVAQLASAPALGAGGPPFESEYPDKTRN